MEYRFCEDVTPGCLPSHRVGSFLLYTSRPVPLAAATLRVARDRPFRAGFRSSRCGSYRAKVNVPSTPALHPFGSCGPRQSRPRRTWLRRGERVTNAYKTLNEELGLLAKPVSPSMFVPRLASDLKCPDEIRQRAELRRGGPRSAASRRASIRPGSPRLVSTRPVAKRADLSARTPVES